MAIDVTLWGAFIAGLISFVSPCVLPLVPPYLCFIAGVTFDQFVGDTGRAERARVVAAAAAFVLGFSVVFIALGATASVFGRALAGLLAYQVEILGWSVGAVQLVAGLVIIAMGLHFLGVFRFALLDREARIHVERKPAGPFGAFLVGLAFAFGWTPCIGPVLGTILFVAGAEDTVSRGATLLAAYSAGLGVPFLAAGLFAGHFMRFMKAMRNRLLMVERTMGALLVVTGVLFISGQITAFSFWLLETFPTLGTLG